MQRKPNGEIQNDSNDRGGDRGKSCGEADVAAQFLDVGSAEENPEKAGREGDPGGEQGAERGREQRRQALRMLPAAHEPDELQNHDERARRRLRQAESVHHLPGLEPAVMRERLLRDVRQDGVGAPESDNRGLAEKNAFLEKRMIPA